MTPLQLAQELSLNILSEGDGTNRKVGGIFCCDLLSIVMGRAKEDDAWITVMSNVNTLACGMLADVSCIILSEGIPAGEDMVEKAAEQGICLLQSTLPTFELSLAIAKKIGLE